ncbi:WD repeat, SAM and U-box domain-containing protein 1-like [Helicoverpa zea]|uniref:WD repeat, SAM and U-box domain-containing protein 1-like n=1 Tax=Helicoverpa zea TaxID=7113 RepID=UPI001F595ED9|nr:WD repeat, SAM and U-box domain-containing protein 1-like [Helicoverpa zea]
MEEIDEPSLIQTLRAHSSEVTCADAAGALLATGGGDRALRLWRWAAGAGWAEAARAGDAHRYGVTVARWAPGGVLLASGGVDGAARVWGRALAPRRLLLAPGAAALRALCWAARARLLAGHDDGALHVWLVPRAELLARLAAHDGALHAVAAPALGRLLLTACTHGVLKVFDLAEVCRSGSGEAEAPAPLAWLDGVHDLGALCADASQDGQLAATGGQDSLVRVWHAGPAGLEPLGPALSGHLAAVTALRWGRRGARPVLASASLDRTARLWLLADSDMRCVRVVHAHSRYLTCVVLSPDAHYMLTGSNDKSLRMWSLGSLSLDDSLDTPCEALAHFGLGDLEGIGPVEEEEGLETSDELAGQDAEADGSGATRLWREALHAGAINCIATHGDLVATASSDGRARVLRWHEAAGALEPLHELAAHDYPVMAADFCAAGAALLTAGLDGRACLWDVESGVQLRSLSLPARDAGAAGEAGGGGVRAARASPLRPALLLLGTDDGLAPLWSLDQDDPRPLHVYAGHAEAVTCCAWAEDARLLATGDAAGELRVLAPPPRARTLRAEPHAHDPAGGIQSCDFASPSALELPDDTYLLATAGCDSLIKLWLIHYKESAAVRAVVSLAAHGGGVASVRWAGARLASAGADRVVRVWQAARGGAGARLLAAVRAPAAALAVALAPALLLAGTLPGELLAWRAPPDQPHGLGPDDDEAAPPYFWTREGVARWLRECVTRVPGSEMKFHEEEALIQRAEDANLTGSQLLSTPIEKLLETFGYERAEEGTEEGAEESAARERLRGELQWLRAPPASPQREARAPHALRCPLSHALLRDPARAADGFTYERANILDWFIAAEGAVSPISGRRLRNTRVQLNYAVRDQLRDFLLS